MTAAAVRKLQKDIEVALKKVDDGIEEFDHVWEQATTSSNSTQKEKLGEELKKSINKLQRLRVQIREWIGQSDIKTNFKDKLEDARKRIEADMQRFKEFERDLKTKAFSACALAKGDELDLEEVEKRKNQEWLVSSIQTMNEQLEEFDADIEIYVSKKSMSNDDKDRLAFAKTSTERHQWHIKKLELLLRCLDNDAVDVSDLSIVRDSIEVYIDMCSDPDYPHDETLYDCFDLHEYEERAVRTPSMDVKQDGETPNAKEEPKGKAKEKEKRKKDDKKEKKKDDKKAATPTATGGASNKAGSNTGRNGDAKAAPPGGPGSDRPVEAPKEVLEEEFKVQADQLLLGGEAEEFVCKICQTHVVGCGPTLTNCSHLFCGDCLAQWFNQHPESQSWAQRAKAAGPDRVVPCPVCKQPLNVKRDLYPVCGATSRSENLLLWRMLSSLKIMCINHTRMGPKGKCDWIGEYGGYQKHMKTCCQNGEPESKEQLFSFPSPAAGVPSVSASVMRSPESRPEPSPEPLEKSPSSHGAPDRSPHGAAPAPAVAAKQPAAKADHPPKAQSTPAVSQAQQAALLREQQVAHLREQERLRQERLRQESAKVAQSTPAVAAPTAAPLVSHDAKSPSSNAAVFHTPVADTSNADASEASPHAAAKAQQAPAPQAQLSPAAASIAAAAMGPSSALTAQTAQPQLQQQAATPAAHSQPQAAAAAQQPRKAAAATQEEVVVIVQATSAFEPNGPNMVPCQIGDRIQVLERHASGWTYCKNLSLGANSNSGWAPSWIVTPASVEEATSAANRKAKERAKEQEAAAQPAPAPAPAPSPAAAPSSFLSQSKAQDTALLPGQQAASKVHRSPQATQPAVAAAPTPQHSMQAAPMAATAMAPKAPSTVLRAATAAFAGSSASQLTVNAGDLVEIVESHTSGWTYGRKVHPTQGSFAGAAVEGWFPDWVCAQKS